MNFKDASFHIIKNHNCPLYQTGDEFKVAGRSISLMGKPACMTLMSDVTETLVNCQGMQAVNTPETEEHAFNCSGYQTGCPGTVRIKYLRTKESASPAPNQIDSELSAMSAELNNFSIFKTLNENEVKEIISYFKVKEFKKGRIILRKGDRGENLYVILSGEVEIIGDYGITISTLGRGEIFGEMSLLTGNPVSTKVRAAEDTKIICMSANYFRMILTRFSPLQMYFTRLLARRLAKSNIERSKQISSGMSGSLSEISSTELLQALNMTQKTGMLQLNLPKGIGRISVMEGNIMQAEFMGMTGQEAFFEIVKQKRGNFSFTPGLPPQDASATRIADFMYLMMEAMNRIDEAASQPEDSDDGM